MLPRERRLTADQESRVQRLMKMHVNKKQLQQQVMAESGHPVLLKDISNINAKAKVAKSRNQLDEAVKHLRDTYGATVNVSCDEKGFLRGIFFQDKWMKDIYKCYPEMVFVDATYKLLELPLPVFIFMVEDGNGRSEVAAVGIIVCEDAEALLWLFNTFKGQNPESSNLRVIMADKDMKERERIKEVFPDVMVLICLFHTLRTFG